MFHPSRPQAHGPARRRRRELRLNPVHALEDRCLPAPFMTVAPPVATFTAAATPTNGFLGTVTVSTPALTGTRNDSSAAPVTSVSMLTPLASFGGDMVRIEAGPGGDFGKAVYAISRGAG